MKLAWLLIMISAIAFSSERVWELCQHHSGTVHAFSEPRCDGEHKRDHDKHHENNEDNHSKKHEPCDHVYIQVDNGAKAPVFGRLLTSISNHLVLTLPRFESDFWFLVRSASTTINLMRGSPGAQSSPARFQETICLRL
jgi:hypothetical protein